MRTVASGNRCAAAASLDAEVRFELCDTRSQPTREGTKGTGEQPKGRAPPLSYEPRQAKAGETVASPDFA